MWFPLWVVPLGIFLSASGLIVWYQISRDTFGWNGAGFLIGAAFAFSLLLASFGWAVAADRAFRESCKVQIEEQGGLVLKDSGRNCWGLGTDGRLLVVKVK